MIYTLTFNPALDYVMRFDKIVPGSVCRSVYEEITAGGKGINVSVVLRELGLSSAALGFTAGFTGEHIERLLMEKGIKCDFIRLDSGFSRINVKLKSDSETDLNARGPEIPDEKIKLLFEKLSRLESGDMLVLAGSVPDTLPPDIYEKILAMLSGKGVRFTVDATGSLLMNVLKYKPFLIKPNNFELGELFGVLAILVGFKKRQSVGFPHADDLVCCKRAGAHAAFVTAAVNLGLNAHARLAANVESADALGAVYLVRGQAHQIDLKLLRVDDELARRLRCVAVKEHAAFAANIADGFDVLHNADFVIDGHHGHERRIRADGCLEVFEVDEAIFLHIEVGDFIPFGFKMAHAVQNSLVFRLDRDEVLALVAIEMRRALNGEVVGFGCARREHDFAGIGVDVSRDVAAGFLHRLFGFPTISVRAACGITELFAQVGDHLFGHAGIDRRGGRVVKINNVMLHFCVSLLLLAFASLYCCWRPLSTQTARESAHF